MNSSNRLSEIEQRLRRDAERLDAFQSCATPALQLHARYLQVRRRRAVHAALAVLAPAVVLIAAWLAFSGPADENPAAERGIARPVPPPTTGGNRAPVPAADRSIAEAGVADPVRGPADRGSAPAAPHMETADPAGPVAIPIVIIRQEGDREVYAPGFLVPAHETPVDVRSLSLEEQRAVRRLLDLEAEPHQAI